MTELTLVQLENSLRIASYNLKQATTPRPRLGRVTRYSKVGSSSTEIRDMRTRVASLEAKIDDIKQHETILSS